MFFCAPIVIFLIILSEKSESYTKSLGITGYIPKHFRNFGINDNIEKIVDEHLIAKRENDRTYTRSSIGITGYYPKHVRKFGINDNIEKIGDEHIIAKRENDRTFTRSLIGITGYYPKHVRNFGINDTIEKMGDEHIIARRENDRTFTRSFGITGYFPKHVRNFGINDNIEKIGDEDKIARRENDRTYTRSPIGITGYYPKHVRNFGINDNIEKIGVEHIIATRENDRTDKFQTNFRKRGSYDRNSIKDFIKYEDGQRKKHKRKDSSSSYSSSSSTSDETLNWKDEWKQRWENIKQIALASNMTQAEKGDKVNMVAARPWGVPCGDPKQHDVPWGSCTLAMECESEYRIYRGDYFCGRTQFVCCSLLLNTDDMYHGFWDIELSGSSLETDSEELKVVKKDKKYGKKTKRKRKRMKHKRKKALKKLIKKTVKEIGKLLNKTYKFGDKARKRKTNQLKRFVKELKKKYKKDRQSMKDIHEIELHKIDTKLNKGIMSIKELNRDLVYNNTIHRWVVNGTLSKHEAKVLRERYPDVWKELQVPEIKRRSQIQLDESKISDYDIEYGILY